MWPTTEFSALWSSDRVGSRSLLPNAERTDGVGCPSERSLGVLSWGPAPDDAGAPHTEQCPGERPRPPATRAWGKGGQRAGEWRSEWTDDCASALNSRGHRRKPDAGKVCSHETLSFS